MVLYTHTHTHTHKHTHTHTQAWAHNVKICASHPSNCANWTNGAGQTRHCGSLRPNGNNASLRSEEARENTTNSNFNKQCLKKNLIPMENIKTTNSTLYISRRRLTFGHPKVGRTIWTGCTVPKSTNTATKRLRIYCPNKAKFVLSCRLGPIFFFTYGKTERHRTESISVTELAERLITFLMTDKAQNIRMLYRLRDLHTHTRAMTQSQRNNQHYMITVGRNSSVGTATHYGLDSPAIEYRGGGARDFPHPSRPVLRPIRPPVQWIPGLSRGVKRPGYGVKTPPPPKRSAEAKERVITPVLGWPLLFSSSLLYDYVPRGN
jgi:hypothetical protein